MKSIASDCLDSIMKDEGSIYGATILSECFELNVFDSLWNYEVAIYASAVVECSVAQFLEM